MTLSLIQPHFTLTQTDTYWGHLTLIYTLLQVRRDEAGGVRDDEREGRRKEWAIREDGGGKGGRRGREERIIW